MRRTSISSSPTSDYSSSSEIDDDEFDRSFAISEENFYIEQSLKLLKIVRDSMFSDEIFIRSVVLLRQYLLRTTSEQIDQSILIALISLTAKLVECSNDSPWSLLNHDQLLIKENLICEIVDWDVDLLTPINAAERFLSSVMDSSLRKNLRHLTNQLIVFCLTDFRCFDLPMNSIGIECVSIAYEILTSTNFSFLDKDEKSSTLIRQVLVEILQH